MADQTITPVESKANAYTAISSANYAAINSANNGVLTVDKEDELYLHLKVTDAAGATVTVVKGTGAPMASQGNLVSGAMAQNQERILRLESGRFMAVSGADKGKIRITSTGAVSVAAIRALPAKW